MDINTKVISGFPGIGKSHFFKNNPDVIVLDSDSSHFSWISKGVRHPDFPQNYMDHIKSNLSKADVILVSSHKQVRDALKENGILYTLIYPDKSLMDEYIARYRARGNDDSFITMIRNNWDTFIDEIEQEEYPTKICLQQNEFLTNVLSKTPRPVICRGLCTSQVDDYCGMHMSNETCPACDAIWKAAHQENEVEKSRKA